MTRPEKLDEHEIAERMSRVPGWEFVDGKLHRGFSFPDFTRAFGFMASVALVAESNDHHPDWSNVYNRVVIDLSTHDAGGVTELDFVLAEAVNTLYGG